MAAGGGVPWYTSGLENRLSGGSATLLDQTMAFAEVDVTLKNYIEKSEDVGWAMDYSVFMRTYFTPVYERSESGDPSPPYLAFGLTVKVGHVRY